MSYKQNWCHGVSHVFCNYSWEQTLHNAIQSYLALHILLTVCSHFLRLLRVLPHYQCSSPPLLSPFSRRCAIFLTFDITSLWVPSLCYAYNDYCSLNMQHIVFNHLQCTKKSLPPPTQFIHARVQWLCFISKGLRINAVQVVFDHWEFYVSWTTQYLTFCLFFRACYTSYKYTIFVVIYLQKSDLPLHFTMLFGCNSSTYNKLFSILYYNLDIPFNFIALSLLNYINHYIPIDCSCTQRLALTIIQWKFLQ